MVVRDVPKVWLSNPEAMQYLGVGSDKLKDMREKAEIHYYKRGKTIWYDIEDLDSYVRKGKVV